MKSKLGGPARLGALALVAFSGGALGARASAAATSSESPYAPLAQLGRVLAIVERAYVEPVDREKLLEGAVKGMVAELDPHSSYLPPAEYAELRADTEGRFAGIGVEVEARDEAITVVAPIDGAPASRAGVLAGDRIVAIDGKAVRAEPFTALVKRMRGAAGTHVVISVRRPGVADPLSFDLVREDVRVPSVATRVLPFRVLYLRIKQFQRGTHRELLEAVGEARRAAGDVAGVVVDLRTNPGGLVDEAASVADEMLGEGGIYSTRHRGRTVDDERADGGGALVGMPMAVLVDAYTASSAELVAAALQDGGRATVVGARTFGKGSVQTILDLPGGAGLRLTTMRYYTPKGRSLQAAGVVPDVLVASARDEGAALAPTREVDLVGHLAAEGEAAPAPRARVEVGDAGGPASRVTTPAAIADDPATGADRALAVAWAVVRGAPLPMR